MDNKTYAIHHKVNGETVVTTSSQIYLHKGILHAMVPQENGGEVDTAIPDVIEIEIL